MHYRRGWFLLGLTALGDRRLRLEITSCLQKPLQTKHRLWHQRSLLWKKHLQGERHCAQAMERCRQRQIRSTKPTLVLSRTSSACLRTWMSPWPAEANCCTTRARVSSSLNSLHRNGCGTSSSSKALSLKHAPSCGIQNNPCYLRYGCCQGSLPYGLKGRWHSDTELYLYLHSGKQLNTSHVDKAREADSI